MGASSFFKYRAMDSALLCKIFFGLGTAVDLGGTLIPSFREQIMNYGSRSTESKSSASSKNNTNIFEYMTSLKVPHTWFTHYYVVSTLSSVFWALQIITRGPAFRLLAAYSGQTDAEMTANQVLIAWSMMFLQGLRRLYESITLIKPSKSTMWVGLWAIGMAYYAFMGISVWIEGISKLDDCLLGGSANTSRNLGRRETVFRIVGNLQTVLENSNSHASLSAGFSSPV